MSQSHFKMWPIFSTPTAQVSRREVNLPAKRALTEHSSGHFCSCSFWVCFILSWTQALFSLLSNPVIGNFIQLISMAVFPFGAGYDTNWPDGSLDHSYRSWWAGCVTQRRGSSDGINMNLRPICTNQELHANIRAWGKNKRCHMDLVQRRWWHRFCSLGGSRTSTSRTELQTHIWLNSLEAARSGAQKRGILH